MDYEKKLALAKEALDSGSYDKETIEYIFPELAESEDERIRKALICGMYALKEQHKTCFASIPIDNAIAWLEKQGEQKSVNWNELTWEDINDLETIMNEVHSDFRNGIGQKSFGLEVLERFLYNKDYEHLDIKSPKFKDGDEIRSIDGQYEDTVLEVLSDGSYRLKNLGLLSIPENEWELVNAPVNGYELIDKKEQEGFLTAKNTQKVLSQQLEKQGHQEEPQVYETEDDEIITYSESDGYKVIKPKFKIGDWIVWDNKISCHIDNIYQGKESLMYTITDINNMTRNYSVKGFDNNAHLWTIQDAKDGDMLHSPTHNLIWIHKDIQHYHACVNMNYVKENFSTDGFIVTPTDVCPATKDKQTILFAEMKEAGYEWDSKKKEPRKIEQKPTDEEMKELLRTEYEKGRADAIAEMQKPWSEEDEEFLRRAINATKDVYPMTAKWLKFLKDRVQPKQEWSKKDNQYLCGLIGLIEQSKAELPITLKGKAADNCIDWLKSLKKRYTWKPSDEQLEALKNAIQIKPFENPSDSILWGLYEQLKKL